jgi:two-component system CheB/CheR fusion protein
VSGVTSEHRDVLNVDVGLPFEQFGPLLRGALSDGGAAGEISLDAINRRGRAVVVRVACAPLRGQDAAGGPEGAIMVMEANDV